MFEKLYFIEKCNDYCTFLRLEIGLWSLLVRYIDFCNILHKYYGNDRT